MLLARGDEGSSGAADPPDSAAAEALGRFRSAVAAAQLREWLPQTPQIILDLSPGCPRLLELMTAAGHTVVHATLAPDPVATSNAGQLWRLRADPRSLGWVADASVDRVVAEGGCLSTALAAEVTLADIHRVLRPDGRILLTVDSLVAGLAALAGQGRWAELADVPAADVVLVPTDDGGASRCFWPEELVGIVTDAGFEVDWIRPRPALAEQAVARALALDPGQLDRLVSTELSLAARRAGEASGTQLVLSASRR
jgi:hypothetical protein